MILIFPVLTSNNVAGNVLPGVMKMVEKYILVHQVNRVLKGAKKVADVEVLGGTLKLKEQKKQPQFPISIKLPGVGDKVKLGVADKPKIEQALALEPTWIKVEMRDGFAVLGVKAVPYPVTSDENLVKLMVEDISMSFWKKTVKVWQRAAVRRAFAIARGVGKRVVGYKGGAITGDPKKDILLAMSEHRHNVFVIVNMIDLKDAETFLRNAGGIRKLYQLGWKSFIVLDDVKRQAHFCLEQFKGMCSMIPYNFMYASLGREHNKVYEDLEDVRKAGASFFRMKTNFKQIVGESVDPCYNLNYMKEAELLTEDFMGFTNKLKPAMNSMLAGLNVAEKKKDRKSIVNVLSKVPAMSLDKIEKVCTKLAPGFKKNYAMANRVFDNSLKGPDEVKRACATLIAFATSYKNEKNNSREVNVEAIKAFTMAARKSQTTIIARLGMTAAVDFDWKVPPAPEMKPGEAVDIAYEWTATWIKLISGILADIFRRTRDVAEIEAAAPLWKTMTEKKHLKTIAGALKETWQFCNDHKGLVWAIVIIALVFIILAYLCREQ